MSEAEWSWPNIILKLWRLGSFGFKIPDGNSYYYLKDHIGNIRVTVNEQGDIVTKDDYFPFGLRMPGLSYNNGNRNDRLKFQSKRLQDYGNWKTYYFGYPNDSMLDRNNGLRPSYSHPIIFKLNRHLRSTQLFINIPPPAKSASA